MHGIEGRGGAVDERAGELERDARVGEVVLDRLERADRHAELPAFLRVLGRHVEHALREAALLRRDADDGAVEGGADRVVVDGRRWASHFEQPARAVDRRTSDQLDRVAFEPARGGDDDVGGVGPRHECARSRS